MNLKVASSLISGSLMSAVQRSPFCIARKLSSRCTPLREDITFLKSTAALGMSRALVLVSLCAAPAFARTRSPVTHYAPVETVGVSSLPHFAPTYVMSRSTIIMPCNDSGYFDPVIAGRYGVVDFGACLRQRLSAALFLHALP